MKVLLLNTENRGWHMAQLHRAFRRHHMGWVCTSLSACRMDFTRPLELVIPGFKRRMPDGVMVRGIAAGTLQQLTLRLDFLHHLHDLGIPVVNGPRALEQCVDKAMTDLRLRQRNIPIPPTWVAEDEHEARAILIRETNLGHDLLYKPMFGSRGKGILRLTRGSQLPNLKAGVYYLQRYVTPHADKMKNWWDWRVLVIGDRCVARMKRYGTSWVNNVSQGGRCVADEAVDHEVENLALAAARATGTHYAGVDIIEDNHGRRLVLEVNSMPSWRGIQALCSFSIADELAGELKGCIQLKQEARQG